MKIIIWGLGAYFKANIEKLNFIDQVKNVITYVDSVKKYIDGVPFLDGVEVQNPNNIVGLDFDLLLIMSVRVDEIKKQAISMGIPENKIIDFETFFLEHSSGFIKCYGDCFYLQS